MWRWTCAVVIAVCAVASEYTVYDHGKECAERIIPIETINCLDPSYSLLNVSRNGVVIDDSVPRECDNPTLVVGDPFACIPGDRIVKLEARNARGERTVTVIHCRRYALRPISSPVFDDIAIIQHNVTTNESCWFEAKGAAGVGIHASPLTPPFSPSRRRGDPNEVRARSIWMSPAVLAWKRCIRCHSAGLWIRSPYISQSNGDGKRNRLPNNGRGPIHFIGAPFASWNQRASTQIRINSPAYDAKFPLSAEERGAQAAGRLAPSNRCTQCHFIGNEKYCSWLIPQSIGRRASHGRLGHPVSSHAWMPPGIMEDSLTQSEFERQYRRALEAVGYCCANSTDTGICRTEPAPNSRENRGH